MSNQLVIQICDSPEEALNYNTDGKGTKAATLTKAVIVRNGTQAGNDTVDLCFHDKNGNLFVAMITGRLLKQVTDIINIG